MMLMVEFFLGWNGRGAGLRECYTGYGFIFLASYWKMILGVKFQV